MLGHKVVATAPPSGGRSLWPRRPTCMAQRRRTRRSVRTWKTADTPRRRPYGRRHPRVSRPLPWAPHAINQTRRGMATVIVRQAAALFPRPHDQARVIRSTATVPDLSAGPASWRAPAVDGEDGGLRDRRLGPAPSRITIVPPGGRPI